MRHATRLTAVRRAREKAAMSFWIKLVLGVAAAYVLIALAGYLGQRRLMYFPDRARTPPAAVGLADVEERVLKTPDGARVIAWYGKARPGQPTLLYFHGNGGSLAARAERIRRFMAEGWGVYMMTYRGYGGSTGVADRGQQRRRCAARLRRAGAGGRGAAVDHRLRGVARHRHRGARGGGAAGRRADPGCALHLDRRRGGRAYPFLPVRCFLTDRYETSRYIASVKVPLLILHGERDPVIPVAMGKELSRLANEPKRLVLFPNGDHSDLYIDGNNAIDAVRKWVSELKG